MRGFLTFVVLAILVSSAAAKPVPRPAAVLAVASRDTPHAYDGLFAFASAFVPGVPNDFDTPALAQLVRGLGVHSLDGIDRNKAVYLIYVDDGATRGLVAIARVADAQALAASTAGVHLTMRGGWAAIGDQQAVDLVAPYALSTLVSSPPPRGIVATIYAPAMLARFHDQIEQARTAVSSIDAIGQMATLYVDGIMSVAQDVDEIRVSIDANAERGAVDIACVPRRDSRFAKFVAQQQASEFAMIPLLATAGPITFAGRLTLGPYRAAMMELMSQLYGDMTGSDLLAEVEALMKAMAGEFAMAMTTDRGFEMTQLYALADPRRATRAIATLFDLFAGGRKMSMLGVDMTYTVLPDKLEQDGVSIRGLETTMDLDKFPPKLKAEMEKRMPGGRSEMHIGTVDKVAVIVSGTHTSEHAKLAIDGVRGKSTPQPSPERAALLDDARKLKDSVVFIIDAFGLPNVPHKPGATAPFAMTLGFANKTARLRIVLPVATARAFAKH